KISILNRMSLSLPKYLDDTFFHLRKSGSWFFGGSWSTSEWPLTGFAGRAGDFDLLIKRCLMIGRRSRLQ
ncbi:MAG: hypothetical protein P8J22_10150, partial [Pseudomonadales bacterium]|nr:hypothetical protein [Pseudomonadales bacterium]